MKGHGYIELLERFAPRVIHDEAQLEATQDVVDDLLERNGQLNEDELAYLDLLSALIEDWEDENVEMPELSGLDLLKVLIDDRRVSQRDLVRAHVFATDSVASEVLAGKRRVTVEHVTQLARFFNLPADLFLTGAPTARSA